MFYISKPFNLPLDVAKTIVIENEFGSTDAWAEALDDVEEILADNSIYSDRGFLVRKINRKSELLFLIDHEPKACIPPTPSVTMQAII